MAPWEDFSELDVRFARSLRRARARRRLPPRRSPLAWRSVWATAIALVAVAAFAQPTQESSNARTAKRQPVARAGRHTSCALPHRFLPAFDKASARTKIPLSLLAATAYQESRLNPDAQSPAGARGLLQLMPATAETLRLRTDVPAQNVLAGARYLRKLLDRFRSVDLALAAYNAGPTAVERAGGAPTLETLRYLMNIQARAAKLAGCG